MPTCEPSVKAQQVFQCSAELHPSDEGQHRGQPESGDKTPSSEEEPEDKETNMKAEQSSSDFRHSISSKSGCSTDIFIANKMQQHTAFNVL